MLPPWTLVVKVLDSPGPPANITVHDVTKEAAVLSWDVLKMMVEHQ